MFCPKCGTDNKDTARFCKNCGEPLRVRAAPAPRKPAWLTAIGLLMLAVVCVVAGAVVYPYLKGDKKIWVQREVRLTTPVTPAVSEVIAPEIRPEEQGAESDWIIWNVPEGAVDPDTEARIKRAAYKNEFLNPRTQEQREKFIWNLTIEMLEVEGEWAILSAAPRDKESGDLIDTEGLPLLGHKVNDHWEIVHPGQERFLQWIPLIPDSLLPPDAKEFLIMRYRGEE